MTTQAEGGAPAPSALRDLTPFEEKMIVDALFRSSKLVQEIPMTDAPAPIPEEMVERSARAILADLFDRKGIGDELWAIQEDSETWDEIQKAIGRAALTAAGVPALLAELAVIDSVLAVGAVADIPDRVDKIQALMNAAAIAEDRLYRAQARVEELEKMLEVSNAMFAKG